MGPSMCNKTLYEALHNIRNKKKNSSSSLHEIVEDSSSVYNCIRSQEITYVKNRKEINLKGI